MSRPAILVFATIVCPCGLLAAPIAGDALTFDGLRNGEQVLAYYDGGFGSLGSGPGPMSGVSFTTGLAADSTTISFGPSAIVTASSVTMNLDTTWSGVLSFYFVGNGSVQFYSGTSATGSLVASYQLVYPPFFPFGAVPGSFRSAVFAPAPGSQLLLDSVTFGAEVIPEPSTAILCVCSIALILAFRRFVPENAGASPRNVESVTAYTAGRASLSGGPW